MKRVMVFGFYAVIGFILTFGLLSMPFAMSSASTGKHMSRDISGKCDTFRIGGNSGGLACSDSRRKASRNPVAGDLVSKSSEGGPGPSRGPVWRRPDLPELLRDLTIGEEAVDKAIRENRITAFYGRPKSPCVGLTDSQEYLQCQLRIWPEGNVAAEPPPVSRSERIAIAKKLVAQALLQAGSLKFGPSKPDHQFPFDTAVGYDTTFWLDGLTPNVSVSKFERGLNVSIIASATKTTWILGDGNRMTCDPVEESTQSINSHRRSIDCSHTYRKMGKRTVIARTHWEVKWEAGEESGSFPFYLETSRQIRVGEIHVLIK